MKTLLTLALLLPLVVMAQTKAKLTKADSDTIAMATNSFQTPTIDSTVLSRLRLYGNTSATGNWGSEFTMPRYKISFVGDWHTKYKPIDTVKCMMHLHSKDSPLEGWIPGYVVLIDGGVSTEFIEWKKPYIPMAVGLFTNTFLGPDKKEVIKDDYVLQLIVTDK